MAVTATLIPAYEPDGRLISLVSALEHRDPANPVVVVDDGSGPQYQHVFDAARHAGAEVLTCAANHGKGHALRTGMAHIAAHHPGEDVVCADCDGQHTPDDIARVADAVDRGDGRIILGSRQLADHVPLRSRFGNTVTRHVFDLATGTASTTPRPGSAATRPNSSPGSRPSPATASSTSSRCCSGPNDRTSP